MTESFFILIFNLFLFTSSSIFIFSDTFKIPEPNPLYNKKKPCLKYNLIFFFCNFMIDLFFVWKVVLERSRATTFKQTHVCVNGQQAQIECSRLWREIKKGKENAATKSEAQKFMLQWKMNVKKPEKGSTVNIFIKAATKKGELVINML